MDSRKRRKFCPPLKVADASQDSCNSNLTPTQTHTILSFCECDNDQEQETVAEDTSRFHSKQVKKRLYNYTSHDTKPKEKKRHYVPPICKKLPSAANVYDFPLTPVAKKKKAIRTQEQVSLEL